MKPDKPDWYEQARGGPFERPLFTDEMKIQVKSKVLVAPSQQIRAWQWTAALAVVLCVSILSLMNIIGNSDIPPSPAKTEIPLYIESPLPLQSENPPLDVQIPDLKDQIKLIYENPLDYPEDYPVDLVRVHPTRISTASVHIQRTIKVDQIGTYFIYIKQEGDTQLYSGMEITGDGFGSQPELELYEIGPVGELPYLNDIAITKSNLFGEFHIRIFGVCGANCVTNDWIHFEEGIPIRDFQLNTHATEFDLDEDGVPEVIATLSSTNSKVLIYKKIEDELRFVDLNKVLEAEHPHSVIYKHEQKIFSAIFPNLQRFYQYKKREDVMVLIQNAEGGTEPLIQGGLYDGTEAISLRVDGSSIEGHWVKDPLSKFGLYLPSTVKVIRFHDGSEYEADNELGILQLRE